MRGSYTGIVRVLGKVTIDFTGNKLMVAGEGVIQRGCVLFRNFVLAIHTHGVTFFNDAYQHTPNTIHFCC